MTALQHHDTSDRSTLLQNITAAPEGETKSAQVSPGHRMARISRPLSYTLLAINTLLVALGGFTLALAAYTLRWAVWAREPNNVYLLSTEMLSKPDPPQSELHLYPARFDLTGTKFIFATGIITAVLSLPATYLVINYCLRPSKHQPQAHQPQQRLKLLLLTTFLCTFFNLVTIFISWGDYYRSAPIILSPTTIHNNRYTSFTPTPELWLSTLSISLSSSPTQKQMQDHHICILVARILTIPILALQILGATLLVVLKRRMATPWIPMRHPGRLSPKDIERGESRSSNGTVLHDNEHEHVDGHERVSLVERSDADPTEQMYEQERPSEYRGYEPVPMALPPALVSMSPQPPVWSHYDRRDTRR